MNTMLVIMFATFLGAVWLACMDCLYRSIQSKREAIKANPSHDAILRNMYRESDWLRRNIVTCRTYQQYCTCEEMVTRWCDTYHTVAGFEQLAKGLMEYLEATRIKVRRQEAVQPMQIRYTEE